MTGNPHFRFRFFNDTLYPSGIVVNAPFGWNQASISLERHKDFKSLIEYFKGNFLWYGTARRIIREVEDDQGPEAKLTVDIDVNYGGGFEDFFEGLVDISQQEDIAKAQTFYKQQAPIIRDDFWAKFINRKDIPVDLQSTVDLDGNSRSSVNKITLPLPSQKIRVNFKRNTNYNNNNEGLFTPYVSTVGTTSYLLFDNSRLDVDEVEERFEYGNQISTVLPTSSEKYYFKAKYGGSYTISSSIVYALFFNATVNVEVRWFIAYRIGGTLTESQIGTTDSAGGVTELVQSTAKVLSPLTLNLQPGDEIYIYGRVNLNVSPTMTYFSDFDADFGAGFIPVYTELEVTADTNYLETETDAYLIGDAAESILSKLVGADNVLVSNLFDSGCERLRAIMRGLHARGYSMSGNANPDLDRSFFMKFDEWWQGAEPLLNLGLGYTEVMGVPKIEIEKAEDFYDPNFTATFENVTDLVRTYDVEKYIKSLEIGFQKWSSESDSGIDDPQTKRYYSTKFATIGQELKVLCKWLTASLAIERSRRNRVELGKDDRNDEEIISICLQEYEGGYTPEFSENFDNVDGLLNPDFRYNIRDSVARMFLRWEKYLNGCLQHTTGEKFYFASGEGNYKMQSKLSSSDCEYSAYDVDYGLAENQDIDVSNDFVFIPKVYKCKVKMSWATYKLIRANRKKAIGISRTETDHVAMFIQELDFKPMAGSADLVLILGENENV